MQQNVSVIAHVVPNNESFYLYIAGLLPLLTLRIHFALVFKYTILFQL